MDANLRAFHHILDQYSCVISGVVQHFSGSHLIDSLKNPLAPGNSHSNLTVNEDTVWGCNVSVKNNPKTPGEFDLIASFTLDKGNVTEANLGLSLTFSSWSIHHYVLMPAALYNGNRFESRRMKYPPILKDPQDIGPDIPTIISDVPRLNIHPGPSRVQQLTRDPSTPAIGFHSPESGLGFWLLTEQSTRLGDSGIDIVESDSREQATISISAPGIRRDVRYTIGDTQKPCADRGANFQTGDTVVIRVKLFFFPCPQIQDLFNTFFRIRKAMTSEILWKNMLPFSSAWSILEEKYNRDNWDEKLGYYSVGLRDDFVYSHWQIGWVGGLMSTYPLLMDGTAISQERAMRTFDFVLPAGQDLSGFFHGCGKGGEWFGDNFADITQKWLLIRKNADALYFLFKQFMLLQKRSPSWKPKNTWEESARRCADAFVRLWDRYSQFGQFIDTQTGDIIVGGSASAAIAPAGLALAWQFYGDADYLRVATASGQYFYDQFTRKGYTTGGPGEILQCPDSESAFGLLESFVVLYEVTQDNAWLEKACDQANQCATWCVPYDFDFPPGSTFGLLDMRTTGSVYANVQNKHSAPGICTLSGDSLFKLFRATGNQRYLELIREIAHSLPQYLSRADRPISAMPPGWMNERVEMSDWLEPVGEIFYGSCWCEVSLMLTCMEIPCLYLQPDTGLVCAIDHIQAEIVENSTTQIKVRLTNPTAFPAEVKCLVENSSKTSIPLGQNALWGCQRIHLEPHQILIQEFAK
jgi:hypothetical protein